MPARLPASPKSATTGLRLEGTCKWTDTLEGWEGEPSLGEPSQRGETPRAVGVFLSRSLQAGFWKPMGEMLLSTGELGFHVGKPAASPKERDT